MGVLPQNVVSSVTDNPKSRHRPFVNQPKLVELETTEGNYVLNLENAVVYWPSKNTRQR
jgi:hypothetical protein